MNDRSAGEGARGSGSATGRIRVLAAVIRRAGRLLVGLRPAEKRHGGLWEFPGGKVEPGEEDGAAIARELEEELDVRVSGLGRVLFRVVDPGSPFELHFVEVELDGEPRPLEHESLGWFEPAELAGLPLAPGDRAFVAWLLAGHTSGDTP